MDNVKSCPKCGNLKLISQFNADASKPSGLCSYCKECSRLRSLEWSSKNKDRKSRLGKRHYELNKDKYRELRDQYYSKNRSKIRVSQSKYYKLHAQEIGRKSRGWAASNPERIIAYRKTTYERGRSIPSIAISKRIACAMRRSLIGGKSGRIWESLVDYTVAELTHHLERQFTKGMNWENMGEWHIDHILPLKSFKFESHNDPEFRRAWSLANLRPLWAAQNLSKGGKMTSLL